jgi:hypothetical protein
MLLKHAPGAKAQESMGNMVISVWFAMDREVCWWHSHPVNVPIVKAKERMHRVNSRIVARYAGVLAGHMYTRLQPPLDECWDALG